MKKILAILFAVLVAISAISIGIVPAAAAYADGRFEVDEIDADVPDTEIQPVNLGYSYDVIGQYFCVLSFLDRNVRGTFTLFTAPAGYYITFIPNIDFVNTPRYYAFDRIDVSKNPDNGVHSFVGYLDGVATEFGFGFDTDHGFILPYLPTFANLSPQDLLMRSAQSVDVAKLTDQAMQPAYFVPDQSLPRILEVWQTVSAWIADGLFSVVGVFYVAGQLTLIGTFSVISVGIALIFLLIVFIRKFLFLRG